jgi:hypothetical protein
VETSKIVILGKPYIISYKDDSDMPTEHGLTNFKNQSIHINESASFEEREETLLHEVIEVLNYQLALNLKHDTIMRLSSGLYACGISVKPESAN